MADMEKKTREECEQDYMRTYLYLLVEKKEKNKMKSIMNKIPEWRRRRYTFSIFLILVQTKPLSNFWHSCKTNLYPYFYYYYYSRANRNYVYVYIFYSCANRSDILFFLYTLEETGTIYIYILLCKSALYLF